MAVNIGSLNKRITFLQYGNTTNDEGFEIDGWTEVATVWAAVKTLQGREYIAAATIQAERTTRFIIRYSKRMNSLLNNKMRVKYGGREFEIKSIINDNEANVTFTIIGEEVNVK
ncbi:phage head closure protein [Bacillus subtilis]|uniref:phage head closure protein n=1 Tax=Bacillus sp. FSL P4-0290 TaxID=2921574 RepID=UPI00279E6B52|nr:phage head closure protein [Bacillus subtilis]WEY97816.1 phage head closure protein [Bacillus subtilis]WEY98874.1 phage head closure protein [Bacillus subtilis]